MAIKIVVDMKERVSVCVCVRAGVRDPQLSAGSNPIVDEIMI